MQYINATFFVRVSCPCRGSPNSELVGFPKDAELLQVAAKYSIKDMATNSTPE